MGEAPAQRLRGFGVDRPDDPGWIGQEGPVDVGESLAELAEVTESRPAVLQLHGLAEGEVPGIRSERIEVPFLLGLDEGSDPTRDRVVVGQALLFLEPDEPDEKVKVARDQEDREQAGRATSFFTEDGSEANQKRHPPILADAG